ncbi:Folate-dependent protein for Fe/S cluster synthesis/repair in oxidative stress [Aequoribacter fuscus]|jgi:folate-binding protein YgfZ|uniref:Folate-dependent protein for Fe/S cluster synthesis/repair in oxidative stress n=1 Tax=Aequoribacter fuscus TaxID=2518989 RepID=F3KZL4_9GAMM|nr:folate-binding protein YgfZ [Aequoribacter fuscus]EGG30443.1 Folate-dependent protein for Fe/S cluster synthesis/repair in oxidative stress [Aequoribacter fuscus]QHJ88190.1 folate-binding protein [Aequoribacter fuscus]
MFKVTPNTYFSALELIGPDAAKTLQGQLTNDVESLRNRKGLDGLLCNLKGRVELVVKVYKHSPEQLTLVVPTANIDALKRRLAPYVAFSKSRLNELNLETYSLVIAPPDSDPIEVPAGLWFGDLGLISPQAINQLTRPYTASSIDEFHHWRIHSGMIQLTPEQSGLYTPQALSLDRLGYVSFKKGCYMGQEIIARLHYKGQSKHQLALLQCSPGLTTESKITSQTGDLVGTVVDAGANRSGYYLASVRPPTDSTAEYFVSDHAADLLKLFSP